MDWLYPQLDGLLNAHERIHHAVLLHGPAGIGREWLACLYGAALLETDPPQGPAAIEAGPGRWMSEHLPDFSLVVPEEGKHWISVDQVRELTDAMYLTSHSGHPKLALIAPAEHLNRNAANSLLKTLEEPPGNAILMLLAESVDRLPATVVSRCRRIRVRAPSPAQALAWLNDLDPSTEWEQLLAVAGGAPLLARQLHKAGFSDWAERFERGVKELENRETGPVQVAADWAKANPEIWSRWLYWHAARRLRTEAVDGRGKQLRLWIERLDAIVNQRRQLSASLNWEAQLAALLSPWYGGSTGGVAK